jgi:hypothetical protein
LKQRALLENNDYRAPQQPELQLIRPMIILDDLGSERAGQNWCPESEAVTVNLINRSWNRITRFTPRDVLQGKADNVEVIESIRTEGKKRKATTLYTDQLLHPGDYVRVSMRADWPARVKGQIKNGTRKVGSEHQWVTDRGEANIRRVKRRVSDTSYDYHTTRAGIEPICSRFRRVLTPGSTQAEHRQYL